MYKNRGRRDELYEKTQATIFLRETEEKTENSIIRSRKEDALLRGEAYKGSRLTRPNNRRKL